MDKMRNYALRLKAGDPYNRPVFCSECNHILSYTGGGTYTCSNCGNTELDDWGKVREYLYANKNASALQIEQALGIPRIEIQQMLRDSKIEVAAGKGSFLHCISCGKPIQSGQYCSKCEISRTKKEMESKIVQDLQKKKQNVHGTLLGRAAHDEGRMRFTK